ncbi:ATP-binding protein [Halobacteria archaeon AArc-curdl1]|uniref:ATP-binding protein n=1 Tax=Natronosalvus hydrolyticus TaxID=2979988 RepID=A0AAP2Z817_9EURY|nr:ATP-binding protein [Halobacteria archaeon AArc-curdl1]
MTDDIDDVLDNDPFAEEEATDQQERDSNTQSESEGTGEQADTIPEESVPSSSVEPGEGEVGHVLASEEIRVTRSEYNVNAFVTTGQRDEVRVGDYVQIPYPDGSDELFAVVDGLRYEPYTELDDKSDTHNQISKHRQLDESEFVLVAELEPIAVVRDNDDGLERGIVNRIPKPNTPVSLSREDEYLRTGLNIPHEGIFAGYLSVGGDVMKIDGEEFPYYITNPGIDPQTGEEEDGEPAIFRHTLVAGSTGAGKTHYTKNLLRQYVDGKRYPVDVGQDEDDQRSRLGVVVFDPENEYWQMRDDSNDLTDEDRRKLRQQEIEYDGVDDLEVFIPEVDNTRPPQTGESQSLTIPFSVVKREPRLLMPFEQGSDITRGAIRSCIEAYFACFDEENNRWPTRGVESPRYDDFVEFIDEHDHSESQLREANEIGDGTWSAVRRRVIKREYFDVFDTGINPFTEITDQLFREGRVSVIPTSHLRGEREYLVVLSILAYIIENKIDDFEVDHAVKRTPLLVAVDEAHNYFSSPDNIREAYIVGRAREAVKQGRKDQLGLMMITQNPEDIDGDILKQTNTNVFLHLREEVVEDVASVPRGYKRDIPKFGKGQAVIKAPDVEAVEVKGLPDCLTRHDN